MVLGQPLKHSQHVVGSLITEPQEDDAAMAAGRVGTRITEAEVEGDERSLATDRCGEHVRVWMADEVFVLDGVDLVAEGNEQVLGNEGDVSRRA